jgi:hypothetical protein
MCFIEPLYEAAVAGNRSVAVSRGVHGGESTALRRVLGHGNYTGSVRFGNRQVVDLALLGKRRSVNGEALVNEPDGHRALADR